MAEVFPPKFQFQSVDEMVGSADNGEGRITTDYGLTKAYRRVYMEGENAKEYVPKAEETQVTKISDKDDKEKIREAETRYKNQDECIWTQNELKALRKFLQKAKMQNLKLAAMLESAQNEIDILKFKYRQAAESKELVKGSLCTFKKKYERLKVNYKALKEDIRRYHVNLKDSRQDCHQLRIERTKLLKSLNNAKTDFDFEKAENERLRSKVNEREKFCDEVIREHKTLLKEQHWLEKASLQKEIDRLEEECGKEKQENALNKKALEHLRTHFANLQIDNETKIASILRGDVLSVIDIDYLPK